MKGHPVVMKNLKRCVLLLGLILFTIFCNFAYFSLYYVPVTYYFLCCIYAYIVSCISYFNNKTRGHYFLDFMKFNGLQSLMYKLKRINYSSIIMVITVHICKQVFVQKVMPTKSALFFTNSIQLNDFKVFEIPTSCTCP